MEKRAKGRCPRRGSGVWSGRPVGRLERCAQRIPGIEWLGWEGEAGETKEYSVEENERLDSGYKDVETRKSTARVRESGVG